MTKYTIAEVKANLSSNDMWVYRGLKRIYANQTQEEQVAGFTKVDNGIGFTGADAPILTSLAQQLQAKGWLSPKQMQIAKRKMPKYAKQLLKAGKA